ncbi:MAG: DUF969 domain-containing protein [Oscillospiraceae bacterium]|nr:DUF969 domain-containing protein [Oscillospiraceae bacterium]
MIKLLGVAIIIVGFALGLNNITVIMLAALVTALVGGLGIGGLLSTLGSAFVANRSVCIFIIVMLLTGTLERNGLKHAAAHIISRIKNSTAGLVIAAYGIMRIILAAFNVGLGGAAGFVRPVVTPMAVGTVEAAGQEPHADHVEAIKGMGAGMENIAWFFGQGLFVGGSGALLVQSTLAQLGYEVSLLDLARVEIPVAIFAIAVTIIYYLWLDKKLRRSCYGEEKR